MDSTTFTISPRGSDQTLTIDLSALLTQLQTVPDQRKRRGVRYPLAVLLAIASWRNCVVRARFTRSLIGHTRVPLNWPPFSACLARACHIRPPGRASLAARLPLQQSKLRSSRCSPVPIHPRCLSAPVARSPWMAKPYVARSQPQPVAAFIWSRPISLIAGWPASKSRCQAKPMSW